MRTFLILLNPFAPHISSELVGEIEREFGDARGDITQQSWPAYDERLLVEDEVEIVIQINGKVRDRMKMSIASYRGGTENGRAVEPESSRPDRW